MKKVLFSLLLLVAQTIVAQQINLNSQYLFNDMLVNPGATGSKDYIPIQLNFRKQWANFAGSPTTQFISAEGKIAKNLGFGGIIFNDISGPGRRTGININTAYHLQLDAQKRHYLGFGVGVSFAQHCIDKNRITTYLPNDPAVDRGYNNQMVPDASFGVFYRFLDKGYVGISAYNLIQTKTDLFKVGNKLYNPLVRTYYLYGGYNFSIGEKSKIKTSTLLRVIEAGTFQFDVSAIYEWNHWFWIGGSYRFKAAAVAMAGIQIKMVRIGYSYDFTLSDIKKYSSGSHEIYIELQLFPKGSNGSSNTPWLKRNKIYSPRI
jgi:type IX secretion system PorP/SprF family membrane protein